MAVELSFDGICRDLKENFPDIGNDLDAMSAVIIAIAIAATAGPVAIAVGMASSPLAIGVTALGSLANMLAVKDAATKLVQRIFNRITDKKDTDPLKHIRNMERAYYLLCYTSFFEALGREEQLTPLLNKVKITNDEKVLFSVIALEKLQGKSSLPGESNEAHLLKYRLVLPHPTTTLKEQKQQLQPLYEQLAKGAEEFFSSLHLWEELPASQQEKFRQILNKLPEKAKEYFEAQYFLLATRIDEFFIWANLQEHEKTREIQAKQFSAFAQKYGELAKVSQQSIDIGFKNLVEVMSLLPENIERYDAQQILKSLENKYADEIKKPIIDVKRVEDEELVYPVKEKIFIPQAFQVIRYTGNEQLGLEGMWKKGTVRKREDLGFFLLSYLQSPYSIETPLLILGDPGSGKSLLTSMLTVRFSGSLWTPIKIPLRNTNAGANIATQIEQQLCQDTNGEEVKWARFARYLQHKPALVIFDGYDELLQATGKFFSDYLLNVQRFQEQELVQERPTRAIVTSRLTLIDKAEIPKGSTIIRLLDFDEPKRQQWSLIWNNTNTTYFQQKKIKPFALPQDNQKIVDLAGQPLLLTMLAIYDSDNNQLHKEKVLNWTTLYHNLIQRFIQRERVKSDTFRSWPSNRQLDDLKSERERLNVAAIAMFNRRAVFIHQTQLENDLGFFQLKLRHDVAYSGQDGRGWALSQADLLLGSFFFVQRSQTEQKSQSKLEQEKTTAFEFLHNTFGEFLAADFILNQAFQLADILHEKRYSRSSQVRREYQEMLDDVNKLPVSWFACQIYTPLYTRPFVVAMMREWLDSFLEIQAQERNEDFDKCKASFLEELDAVINSHIRLLLLKNTLPNLMTEQSRYFFLELPTLGYLAIYTLNLILLRTIVSPSGYIFDEGNKPLEAESRSSQQDEATSAVRLWDRLTYLWRAWFSLEDLNELATVLSSERKGNKIYLKIHAELNDVINTQKISRTRQDSNLKSLSMIRNVGEALADNIAVGLSGLLSHDAFYEKQEKIDIIRAKFSTENININSTIYLVKRLYHLLGKIETKNGLEEFLDTMQDIFQYGGWDNVFGVICIANSTFGNGIIYRSEKIESFSKRLMEVLSNLPRGNELRWAVEILKLINKIGRVDPSISEHLKRIFRERVSPKTPLYLLIIVELFWLASYMPESKILFNENLKRYFEYKTHEYTPNNPGDDFIYPSLATELIKKATEINRQDISDEVWRLVRYSFPYWIKDLTLPPEVALEIYTFAHEMKDRQFIGERSDYFQKLFDYYLDKCIKEKFGNFSLEQLIALFKLGRLCGQDSSLENSIEAFLHIIITQKRLLTVEMVIELSQAMRHLKSDKLKQIKLLYQQHLDKDNLIIGDLSVNTAIELRSLARLVGDGAMVERIKKLLGV